MNNAEKRIVSGEFWRQTYVDNGVGNDVVKYNIEDLRVNLMDVENRAEWRRKTRVADPSPKGSKPAWRRERESYIPELCICLLTITHPSSNYLIVTQPGIKPMTPQSLVWHRNAMPLSHHNTCLTNDKDFSITTFIHWFVDTLATVATFLLRNHNCAEKGNGSCGCQNIPPLIMILVTPVQFSLLGIFLPLIE